MHARHADRRAHTYLHAKSTMHAHINACTECPTTHLPHCVPRLLLVISPCATEVGLSHVQEDLHILPLRDLQLPLLDGLAAITQAAQSTSSTQRARGTASGPSELHRTAQTQQTRCRRRRAIYAGPFTGGAYWPLSLQHHVPVCRDVDILKRRQRHVVRNAMALRVTCEGIFSTLLATSGIVPATTFSGNGKIWRITIVLDQTKRG